MSPLVSILLPAYNCEKYLQQAIDSLLMQTFTDYELLIINDGSTDSTTAIINSYSDQRIEHVQNDGNKGLIYCLNLGIQMANGKYIARMDADDVCQPQRLEKQVQWMEKNELTAMVACTILFIDEQNKPMGNWALDKATLTATAIKKTMPWQCCIAHPSVLMRSSVLKKYTYAANQKHTEDYDLWMQLLADGHTIEKLPETLLHYRVHAQSVTGSIHRKKNPFFTNYQSKRKFLWSRISKLNWGWFETKVACTQANDLMMGIGKHIIQVLKN